MHILQTSLMFLAVLFKTIFVSKSPPYVITIYVDLLRTVICYAYSSSIDCNVKTCDCGMTAND